MIESEHILLKDVRHNIGQLISLVEDLRHEKQQLDTEKSSLQQEIEQLKEIRSDLERRYDNLKLARSMAGEEGSSEAKLKVNKIVREIDKCIALLNR